MSNISLPRIIEHRGSRLSLQVASVEDTPRDVFCRTPSKLQINDLINKSRDSIFFDEHVVSVEEENEFRSFERKSPQKSPD